MENNTQLFASGVATISFSRCRFALPSEVVRAWSLGGQSGDEVLIAEIIEKGHIRLRRQSAGKERIQQEKKAAERDATYEADSEGRFRVLSDRYREVSFSKQDNNRISLSQELVLALLGDQETRIKAKVYVEAGATSIDIMTNDVRIERLRSFSDE